MVIKLNRRQLFGVAGLALANTLLGKKVVLAREKGSRAESSFAIFWQMMQSDLLANEMIRQLKDKDEINVSIDTLKKVYEQWLSFFGTEDGSRNKELTILLNKIQPWIRIIEKQFAERSLPKQYAYLILLKGRFGGFDNNIGMANNGNIGISKEKAGKMGLRVEDNYDERRDPVKVARVIADKLLYANSAFAEDSDLKLLSIWNPYVWKYYNYLKSVNKLDTLKYINFLHWRQEEINKILSQEFQQVRNYTITEEDCHFGNDKQQCRISWHWLATFFNVPIETLKKANVNLNNKKLVIGDRISIPGKNIGREVVIARLREELGNEEKLDYPIQFLALIRTIEESEQKQPTQQTGVMNYQEYSITQQTTLQEVANKHHLPLKLLQQYNPAIINSKDVLPQGIRIRIPGKAGIKILSQE